MKIKFKHQKFQADAARAVCDVFAGQPYITPSYLLDHGVTKDAQFGQTEINVDFTGFNNQKIVPELTDDIILENMNRIQRSGQLEPSHQLEGRYNFTIEMETGVGKTYTYIKTMYDLNTRYGWSKFIIVVPSVAIREGVYTSFQITQEHFAEEYGKKIRFFIYNSSQLTEIDQFASESSINVMIINSQAFNATGKDARRIYMKLDSFRSRRPIDIIAKTNPIVIIDEPQSVEGKQTKERLKDFNPLFTLRYSATHKEKYNMIYRLDAMEAYNKKLVKKIAVKGITVTGSTATEGYVYVESINLSPNKAPTVTIEFDFKGKTGVRKVTRKVDEGFNLFVQSDELEEYRNGFTILHIDGRDNSVEFINGVKIFAGDVIGEFNENQLRRIQIRETIISHLERERQLFRKDIKVLSLFFIDEVAKYKQYDSTGNVFNGVYADIFEEEYSDLITRMQREFGDAEYLRYIDSITANQTHKGYFSIDKNRKTGKERFVDGSIERKTGESTDTEAYDLIMKNKELLLDFKEPVRFIFSHSALREGWDNPNVFQICTLKQSGSDVRKRQEVGRGLRLSVNQSGERMDTGYLGDEVQNVNILTVIANESYDSFSRALQSEIAEAVSDRPQTITVELFKNKVIKDAAGAEKIIDDDLALTLYESLISEHYVKKGTLTDKYYEDKKNGLLIVAEELVEYKDSVISIIDSIYDSKAMHIEDARSSNIELHVDDNKLSRKEFQELWKRINSKSAYVVDFETDELIQKSIDALNQKLLVSQIFVKVESGTMDEIKSKDQLIQGEAFHKDKTALPHLVKAATNLNAKYDLIGKIVAETGLTRATVIAILKGIEKPIFDQFQNNPEDFIIKAAVLINEQKATVIIQHITYNKIEAVYDTSIFTEPTIKGSLKTNAMATQKHLYDYVIYDSTNERRFAEELESSEEVAVYVKLPAGFAIKTPVGEYRPDWAIAFNQDQVKHIYFVAETKGSMSSMQLRQIEAAKIHCAKEHFKAISTNDVKYEVVDSYDTLMNIVMK